MRLAPALDADGAPVPLDDATGHGEPEPRALAFGFVVKNGSKTIVSCKTSRPPRCRRPPAHATTPGSSGSRSVKSPHQSPLNPRRDSVVRPIVRCARRLPLRLERCRGRKGGARVAARATQSTALTEPPIMGRTSAGAYRRIAGRLACVTQVLTVQVYSLSLRWWQLSRRWPVKLKPSPARRRRYERPFSAFSAERRPCLPAQGRWGRPLYALQVSALIGDIPSVLAGETLHATTIAWPDQVDSEAALAALAVSVAGTSIGADFVMAQASAVLGAAGAGTSNISNLDQRRAHSRQRRREPGDLHSRRPGGDQRAANITDQHGRECPPCHRLARASPT